VGAEPEGLLRSYQSDRPGRTSLVVASEIPLEGGYLHELISFAFQEETFLKAPKKSSKRKTIIKRFPLKEDLCVVHTLPLRHRLFAVILLLVYFYSVFGSAVLVVTG